MANPEHVEIVKQGAEAIRVWRERNPDGTLDLGGADLRRTYVTNANLRGANLCGANLLGANLCGANLCQADLFGVNLRAANLRGADLRAANLSKADLSKADLRLASVYRKILHEHVIFGEDEWRAVQHLRNLGTNGLEKREADLNGADLSLARLDEADLSEADLSGANLSGANLSGADLGRAFLRGTHFREASLRKASLREADLSNADLSWADLSEADLSRANFNDAFLGEASVNGATLNGTGLGNVDLSATKGLEAVEHKGPSTVGIDTLCRSQAKIPAAFLRGCGVPDGLIDYLASLLGSQQAVQFYSCFISYSHKDEDFAKQLNSRMQDEHLRVWYAPEELKGGRKLHKQIDEAIRVFDKLLLVLSENSMASEWVATEIYHARQREVNEKKRILFPIRLVPFEDIRQWKCFDADTGKDMGREIREYFIPDFSNWKDHDAFEAAFKRLLDDLKAEAERDAGGGDEI